MNNQKKFVVIVVTFIAVVIIFIYNNQLLEKINIFFKNDKPNVIEENIMPEELKREDFSNQKPRGFPQDIPVESDAKIEQSYIIKSSSSDHLALVFESEKTIKENFDMYDKFLTDNGWTISSKSENENLSFLYGVKGMGDVNITIFFDTNIQKTKVSIGFLLKK